MKPHIAYLKKIDACPNAVEWAEKFDSLQEAWDACERGDWMIWFIAMQSGRPGTKLRKKLILTTCKCARLALPYVGKGETRPLATIETAEDYAKGVKGITLKDVRNAAYVTYAVTSADYAVVYAARVTFASTIAHAAAYAASVVSAVTDAAADADTAWEETLKKCAEIVRGDHPKVWIKK